jgi:uncharacterized protein YggE
VRDTRFIAITAAVALVVAVAIGTRGDGSPGGLQVGAIAPADALAGKAAPPVDSQVTGDGVARFLTFNGTGAVTLKPDTASISFSATGGGDSTKQALAASTATMQKLMAVVDDLDIPDNDVVSEGVYTYQDYDAPRGWHASNTVRIQVEAAKAGAVMSKLADAGADGLSGPSFALEDQRDAYRQALRSAIGDARSKADAAAETMGVKVSGVASITESGGSAPMPMMYEARGAADSAASAPVPTPQGSLDVQAMVTVTFTYAS